MKPKLTLGVSILIALVLVAFGLVYGNVSGYADERAHVTALLEGDGGLETVLGYRAADGLNLCVIAARHLPDAPETAALRTAAQAVRGGQPTLAALKTADEALTAAFKAAAAALRADAGFQADARDPHYLELLDADFTQFGQHAIYATYNKAAAEYNASLDKSALGDVARFFGVKPCELFA